MAVLPSIEEPSDRPSVEVIDNDTSSGAVDGGVVKAISRPSTAVREHSWDPSQGSDYVYSDEEVRDRLKYANHQQAGLRNDSNRDNDLSDDGDEDEDPQIDEDDDIRDEEQPGSEARRELNDKTVEHVNQHEKSSVSSEDGDARGVIDLTSPAHLSSEEPPLRTTRSSRPSRQLFGDRGPSTSPESDEPITRTRKRRFGMFASEPSSSMEADFDELSDGTPPRRLRDLVRERARKRNENDAVTKKARYNLRPRQQQQSYNKASRSGGSISMADELASETDREAKEQHTPRRITRSITTQRSAKKPIPRWKAARKTAWSAMGIVPKDDTNRRSYQKSVAVVIPEIVNRSTWGPTQSYTSSPRPERGHSPAVVRDLLTPEGDHRMAHALAGKGIKRMTSNDNINEEETRSEKSGLSKNKKQILEVILID